MQKHLRNLESGNILLYILGAIFLLGLLVIMVKGSTTPGASIDREALELRVNEVQQYGNELERAVVYILQSGFSESDIRFAHPNAASAYGDITDIPERQVFNEFGGGATYREAPTDIQVTPTDWIFNARNVIGNFDSCFTDSCVDLVALLMNVSEEFCIIVNDKNNMNNPDGTPLQDNNVIEYSTLFDGTYIRSSHIVGATTGFSSLEGCVEGDTDPAAGTFHYFRVLLPR